MLPYSHTSVPFRYKFTCDQTYQIISLTHFPLFLILFYLVVLSLHCCTGFSPVIGSRSYSLAAVHGLLFVTPSLFAEHRLWSVQASVDVICGLSSCVVDTGLVALQHVGSSQTKDRTWFPALTDGFFITEPPGEPPGEPPAPPPF